MKNRIHVIQIVLSLKCGGLERLVLDLASRLNNSRFRSSICCLDEAGELASEAEALGIKVIVTKRRPGRDVFLPFKLAKILKEENVDIVHTHNPGALIYGTIAARLAGTKVVINTRHGRERRPVNGLIWAMNDTIAAISKDAKERLLKYNKINPKKINIVHNGVEIERFSSSQNKDTKKKLLNTQTDCQIIGTVSRLAEEKDQFTILEAFSKVSKNISKVRLVFVGDGPLRKELENYSGKIGISNKVIFLGFQKDIGEIVKTFNLFSLPSLTEGISLSLLEAMAAGKPCVATNVGGNPEVVVDGETGILVPPKDPQAMADAIVKILRNPELAQKMGAAGRRRVEEKFSLDRMVGEYEELYEKCLSRKGIGGPLNI